MAISIVDEKEAEATLRFADQMGELDELEPEKQLQKELLSEKEMTGA